MLQQQYRRGDDEAKELTRMTTYSSSDSSNSNNVASPPVRNTLRLLEQKGLMPSDMRATQCIIELSNAIEPFLQTGGSTETGDGDTEVSQSVKGKYHPQPSIGLMKNQSAESGWGLRASASPDEVAGMSIILTEKEQANIHAALNRALVHIARLEERSTTFPSPARPTALLDSDAISTEDNAATVNTAKWRIVQDENEHLHQHIGGLERQLGHFRAEREKLTAASKVVAAQHSRDNASLRTHLVQARKESDASKTALRDKEASLQAALTKLGICVDEGKRLKHQCQLLECANAHNRLQSRMGASQTSATAAANAALISGERDQELFATGSAFSMSNSMELAGTSVSSDFLKRSSGSGPSPYIIGGNGNPSLDPLLNASSDFEGRKKEQQKYGLDAALNLQVTVDTIRQELHKEKVARGREKAAMSVAVEEAVARATFSETMLSDLKIQLTREKERRNTAEKEKDDMSAEQQLMTICIGQKEGKVRELQYEIELQKERTLRIEAEMEELTVTAVKEKSFMFNRTADLTECVSLMRMGIVEAQGELAVQTSVSGETAVRASRENERIEERLNGLVAEYEELWKHSQQQDSYLRSSGSLINTLTQKITNESNLPSPSKDNMKKIEDLKKEFKEASKQREAEVQDQMEILTQEYLENIRDKESMICELRSVKDASELRESETAMQMELLILEYSENIEDKENLICELRGQLEEASGQLSRQEQISFEHQQHVGELQTEFMRDAEATSSQIQVMSSRLIAMSQENTSLKERMREDSDTASDEPRVQIEFGDVSELEPGPGPGPGEGPVTVTVEPESRRDLSAYSAAVARIREGRGLATATKPVVVDTSYLVISSSSSPSKRMSDRMMKLGRKTDSSSRVDEKEGEVDIGVYQNVNRASLIIEAIRTAGVEGTAPGSGAQQPSSSSVCIDRSSLLQAVTALCDEMYEIQQKLVDPTDNNDSRYPAKSRSDSSRSSLGHNSKSQAETETELLRAKMQIVALKGQLEVAAGSGLNDSDMKPVGRGGNEAFMEMRRVLSREGSRTSIAEVKQSEVEAELERTESIRESGRYRYDMDQTKQERSDRVDSEGQWENAGVRDSRRSSIIGGNNEAADTGKVSRRGSQSEFLEEEYCLSSLERSDYNGRERKEDFVEGAHRRRGAAIGGSDFLRGIELESTDEGDGGAQRGDADLDNRTQVPDVSPPDTSRVNETDGRRGSVRGEGRSQSVGFVEDTNEDKKSRWMSVGSEKSEGFSSIGESHDYVDDIDTGDNVLEVSNRGGVRADGRSSILGSYSNDKEFDMRKRSGLVPSSAAGYATGETGTRRFSDNLQRTDEFDLMSQSDRESRRGTEVVSWWKAIEPRSPPTPSTASQTRSNRRVDSSRTAGKDSGRYSNNGSFLADANVETGAGAESMGTRVPTDNSYNTDKRESGNEESRHGSGRYSAYDMDQTRAERSDRADSEGQWENAGVRDSRRSSIIGGNNEAADTGKVSRRGSQSDNVRTDGRQSSVSFQGDGLMNRVELDGRTQDEKEMLQAPGKHSTDDSRDVKDISSVEKEWGEMEGTTSRGGTVGRSRMSSVGPQVESDTARRISVGLDRRMHSIGGDSQSSAMGDNDIDWDRGIEDNINSEGQWEDVGVRENRRSSIIGAKYEDIEELARRGSQSESMSGLREDSISTSSSSSSSSRSLLKNHEVSNYIQSRSRIASVDNRVEKESAVKSDSGDDDFRNISVQLREERSRVKYLQALVDAQSESGEADSNRAVRSGNSGEPLRRSLISNGTRPDTRDLGSAQDLYVIKLAAQDDKIKKLEEDLLETLETSRELEIKMEERLKKLREREERIMDAVDNERSQLELIVRLQEKERHLTEEARDQEERWDKLAARHSKLQDTFAAEKKDLEGQVSELQGIISQLRSETSQRSDEMKEELLTVYEQRLKAMGESYHLHHTQIVDSHGQEVDALSSRLAQAEDDVQKLREEEHNAVALVAASDQKHQIELDALGKQLEGRYEQHLGALRKQYESQCSRLQEQLSGLHAQFQERGTPRRNSSMLSNGDPSYGDGPLTGRSDQGSTGYGEREELEKRIRQAEARSIALTQQLQSMPSSLQVAQAERRVTEARLQKALAASDARIREQIYSAEAAKKELESFLELAALEKSKLLQKLEQKSRTIHQLTHHLHSLQNNDAQKRSMGEQRDIMMAAEVSMAMSQMAPTPWDATSAGNRQSRMSVSSSVDAGLRGWDPSPSDTAFTHMMTASVPPYRSDPLVLPSSSLFPASFSNSLETGRGGSGPGIRRPLNASFTALNNTEVEEDKDKEDEESSPYYYRPASAGPILSTHRSLSMLPLSAPQKSHSPRGLAEFRRSTGSIPTMSESEDEVKGDGEASRDINIGFAAKSPITPSGLSHSRTVVLPWQNPFPLPLYPGTRERESAIHFGLTPTTVDLQQRTEDPIRIPSSGSLRETEKDVNNDTNSQSSLPSVQSMLTTDTVTMAALVVAQTADAASCPPESGVASATSTLGLSSEGGSINQKKGTGRISISSKASSNREY